MLRGSSPPPPGGEPNPPFPVEVVSWESSWQSSMESQLNTEKSLMTPKCLEAQIRMEISLFLILQHLIAHAGGRAYFFKERFPPRKPPPFPRKKEKSKNDVKKLKSKKEIALLFSFISFANF